jgi:hypothetical protein
MKGIPEVGKTYFYFDDGKIKRSRCFNVTIQEIIPFDKIDKDILSLWQEEVRDCHWLYATKTDFFVKGLLDVGEQSQTIYFVRTKTESGNDWFSLALYAGRLDLNGDLFVEMSKR